MGRAEPGMEGGQDRVVGKGRAEFDGRRGFGRGLGLRRRCRQGRKQEGRRRREKQGGEENLRERSLLFHGPVGFGIRIGETLGRLRRDEAAWHAARQRARCGPGGQRDPRNTRIRTQ